MSTAPAASPALERALSLLEPAARAAALAPSHSHSQHGYLDLLGERDPTGAHPGQRLMLTGPLAQIYERIWRPLGARLLMGVGAPGRQGEQRIALAALELSGDENVLDVACGPGNFARVFAAHAGLVVGLDASEAMLARAVAGAELDNAVYMRGDAAALPFRDGVFQAVCCFAALYLIEQPMAALDEIVRVLAPGGRVALLASCNRGPFPAGVARPLVHAFSGVRLFGREELTGALADRGMTAISQQVAGLGQFVAARKPGG